MVMTTGKVIKVKLNELVGSEIVDNLNKVEIKDIYRKFYSGGSAVTAYEVSDRHERSWMAYVVLNLMLFGLYIFTNVAAAKLVHIELFDIVVTPGLFYIR